MEDPKTVLFELADFYSGLIEHNLKVDNRDLVMAYSNRLEAIESALELLGWDAEYRNKEA